MPPIQGPSAAGVAPPWWTLLTPTMRKDILAWLKVRHVDTTGWPK